MDIEREITKLQQIFAENTTRINGLSHLADDLQERTCQVWELFYVMEEIVEEYRAIAGRVPVVVWAEEVMKEVAASDCFVPTREQEREQIDLWIETVGTAPPGVNFDLSELNPPSPKPR